MFEGEDVKSNVNGLRSTMFTAIAQFTAPNRRTSKVSASTRIYKDILFIKTKNWLWKFMFSCPEHLKQQFRQVRDKMMPFFSDQSNLWWLSKAR
jgi:hypothetical protein